MTCGKFRYTKREAAEILNRFRHHCRIRGDRKPQRKYFCEDCKAWHLTSQKNIKERIDG